MTIKKRLLGGNPAILFIEGNWKWERERRTKYASSNLAEHSPAEGTLVEGTLVQGTLVEDKGPLMDTLYLVEEEHQPEAVADDRSSSW
ncbi:uncharacterized protein LOC114916951 [Cajanus cajan]|uniref:uncharacterized protein LOC114916951 n=1 Tax=Cajanus cajan TaxID=3821 RepID=UPI0010FAF8E5|nr:uncharacterized protein LOC114916951 [Cajanus cajan]